jgi:hypothetical protein
MNEEVLRSPIKKAWKAADMKHKSLIHTYYTTKRFKVSGNYCHHDAMSHTPNFKLELAMPPRSTSATCNPFPAIQKRDPSRIELEDVPKD